MRYIFVCSTFVFLHKWKLQSQKWTVFFSLVKHIFKNEFVMLSSNEIALTVNIKWRIHLHRECEDAVSIQFWSDNVSRTRTHLRRILIIIVMKVSFFINYNGWPNINLFLSFHPIRFNDSFHSPLSWWNVSVSFGIGEHGFPCSVPIFPIQDTPLLGLLKNI